MKVNIILVDGQNILRKGLRRSVYQKGKYEETKNTVSYKKESYVIPKRAKGEKDFFIGNRLTFLINTKTKRAMSYTDFLGTALTKKEAQKLAEDIETKLDQHTKVAFWKGLFAIGKQNALTIIILALFAGMGLMYWIRIILISTGRMAP